MKIKFAILMSITMLAGILTACQQTPENEIVIGKGDVTLEQTINGKSDEANTGVYEAPKTLETKTEKNGITLSVDATVDIPSSDKYSVSCVVPNEISQDTANKIWDTLIGDTILYENLEWDYKTKSETEEIIIELKKIIAESEVPQQKDIDNLEKWESWYSEAPDKIELEETAKIFKEIDINENLPEMPKGLSEEEEAAFKIEMSMASASMNEKEIIGTGTENGFTINLKITEKSVDYNKSLDEKGYSSVIWDKKDTVGYENKIKNNFISLEQAQQTAEATISNMGIDYFGLSNSLDGYEVKHNNNGDISELCSAYVFTFTRELNGVTENLVTNSISTEELDSLVVMPMQNENIQIIISEDGLVSFKWSNPSSVKEMISENVELLSFDKINDIFTNQIFLSNNELDIEKQLKGQEISFELKDKTIVIDTIKLGMARVMRQGHDNEYLTIPVWDFYGYETAKFNQEDALTARDFVTNYFISENGDAKSSVYKTYLTISALDGSIIDRTKGY